MEPKVEFMETIIKHVRKAHNKSGEPYVREELEEALIRLRILQAYEDADASGDAAEALRIAILEDAEGPRTHDLGEE